MKILNLTLLTLFLSSSAMADPLECKIGPILEKFGGNTWQVYACSDGQSIVAVSAPGNPAMPFFFAIQSVDGKYQVSGEGNGDKKATSSAYEDLKSLSKEEILILIEKAKLHSKSLKPDATNGAS